jgi:hypothetical protein
MTFPLIHFWCVLSVCTELSAVFWERVLVVSLEFSFIGAFIGFAAWAGLTMAVLMMMESMSASLHALRLHWYVTPGSWLVIYSYCIDDYNHQIGWNSKISFMLVMGTSLPPFLLKLFLLLPPLLLQAKLLKFCDLIKINVILFFLPKSMV